MSVMEESEPDWRLGRCVASVEAGANPDDWFPNDWQTRNRAKAVCQGCPIRQQCKEYAKQNDLWGYWGGQLRGYQLSTPQPLPARKPKQHGSSKKDRCPVGHRDYKLNSSGARFCVSCNRKRNRDRYRKTRGKNPDWKRRSYLTDADINLRQDEVNRLTGLGYSMTQIAAEMQIDSRTVSRYRQKGREQAA